MLVGAHLREKANTVPRKGSGSTERVKDGGKDVWIKQQVGIEVAFILGALPFFFFNGVC